jgi:hypothetical protein
MVKVGAPQSGRLLSVLFGQHNGDDANAVRLGGSFGGPGRALIVADLERDDATFGLERTGFVVLDGVVGVAKVVETL